MFFIANQITPAPGKVGELRKAAARATEVAKAHGEKLIAGFQIAMGQGVGNLVYISAYDDGDAYEAAMKAVEESGDGEKVGKLIASSTSAVLQPLPDSPLHEDLHERGSTLYIGILITPVPGMAEAFLAMTSSARQVAEANGARPLAGFQVSLGPNQGSLFYIVGYEDDQAYLNTRKALADSGYNREVEPLIASSSSSVLQLLPEAAIQVPEETIRIAEPAE